MTERRDFLRALVAGVAGIALGPDVLEAYERLTHRKVYALGPLDYTLRLDHWRECSFIVTDEKQRRSSTCGIDVEGSMLARADGALWDAAWVDSRGRPLAERQAWMAAVEKTRRVNRTYDSGLRGWKVRVDVLYGPAVDPQAVTPAMRLVGQGKGGVWTPCKC